MSLRRLAYALTPMWLAASVPSCAPLDATASGAKAAPVATPVHFAEAENAIVVTIDGARWQEVFQGGDGELAPSFAPAKGADLMPNLHALIAERGALLGGPGRGEAINASGPNFVSLPGYTELFTGRTESRCGDNDCRPVATPTIADEMCRGPFTDDVAILSSWERIERAATRDPSRMIVSTGRNGGKTREALRFDPYAAHLLDAAAKDDAFPGDGDYRPDRETAQLALYYLRTHKPRFLFVGLGDTDEYAHRGDYAGYVGALHAADAFVGALVATMQQIGGDYASRTVVVVTADHGRAASFREHGAHWPESRRIWLAALGPSLPKHGVVPLQSARHLADVAPTLRAMLGLPRDEAAAAGEPIDELGTRIALPLAFHAPNER